MLPYIAVDKPVYVRDHSVSEEEVELEMIASHAPESQMKFN